MADEKEECEFYDCELEKYSDEETEDDAEDTDDETELLNKEFEVDTDELGFKISISPKDLKRIVCYGSSRMRVLHTSCNICSCKHVFKGFEVVREGINEITIKDVIKTLIDNKLVIKDCDHIYLENMYYDYDDCVIKLKWGS